MNERLKNFLSKIIDFINRRRFSFWAILFLSALGIAFPFQHAHALFGIIGDITITAATMIANVLIGTVFQLIAALGNVLLTIASGILTWVLQLNLSFTALTYADGTKTIVGIGWPLVRDLANIGLILTLVYIGLATALRMAGFETQRTFITLLVVALLINFTPQICGVIIDASNVLINFFLKDVILSGWDDVAVPFVESGSALVGFLDNPLDLGFMGKSIGLAFYGFMGAAIIFVYAILFIMRYIAIWILVIMSPIYFVFYILPSTKKYFSEWWNQFLQWCFIGVSCSFFLYLSRHLLYRAGTKNLIDTAGAPGAVASILPYFVVIALLWYGLFTALASSGTGASGVISGAQGLSKKYWGKSRAGAYNLAKGRITQSAVEQKTREQKMREKEQDVARRVDRGEKIGLRESAGLIAGKGMLAAGGLLNQSTRWAYRASGTTPEVEYLKDIESRVAKNEKTFGKDTKSLQDVYKKRFWLQKSSDPRDEIALGLSLAKIKGGEGLKALGNKEFNSLVSNTAKYAPSKLKEIVKHKQESIDDAEAKRNGDIEGEKTARLIQSNLVPKGLNDSDVEALTKKGYSDADAIRETAFKKATDELKNDEIDNLSDGTINHSKFKENTVKFKNWGFVRKLAEEKGSLYAEDLLKTIQDIGVEEVAKTNPTVLRSITSRGGQQLFGTLKDKNGGEIISTKQINEIINGNKPGGSQVREDVKNVSGEPNYVQRPSGIIVPKDTMGKREKAPADKPSFTTKPITPSEEPKEKPKGPKGWAGTGVKKKEPKGWASPSVKRDKK